MKKAVAVFCILALVLSLIGCNRGTSTGSEKPATVPKEESQAPSDKGDSGKEKDPSSYSGKASILTWSEDECKTYAAAFNKVYPNIEVEIILADNGDVYSKLLTLAASGGEMPDLAYVEMSTRGQHLALDIWEDLSKAPYNYDGSLLQDALLSTAKNSRGEICIVEQNIILPEWSTGGALQRNARTILHSYP